MKKLLFAALMLTSASAFASANGSVVSNVVAVKSGGHHISASEVPAPVMESFNSRFPDATNVQWQVEKEHGSKVYQAEFTLNGKRFKAQFAPDGTFLGKQRA
jgi:hypothetical protein